MPVDGSQSRPTRRLFGQSNLPRSSLPKTLDFVSVKSLTNATSLASSKVKKPLKRTRIHFESYRTARKPGKIPAMVIPSGSRMAGRRTLNVRAATGQCASGARAVLPYSRIGDHWTIGLRRAASVQYRVHLFCLLSRRRNVPAQRCPRSGVRSRANCV